MQTKAQIQEGIRYLHSRLQAMSYLLSRVEAYLDHDEPAKSWSALIELTAELVDAAQTVASMEGSPAFRE